MVNITNSDCEKILLKELQHSNFVVLNFEVEQIGDFLGFLGDYYRIKIRVEIDGKLQNFQYFMKTMPNGKDREVQEKQGFHKKEITLYEKVFGEITTSDQNSWCPKFLLSKNDALVLEDLSVKGYKILPFGYKFNQAHVEESLKSLARFHTCSIIHDYKNSKKRIGKRYEKILLDKSFVPSNPWVQNGFHAIKLLNNDIKISKKAQTQDQVSQIHFEIRKSHETLDLEKAQESLTKKLNQTFKIMNHPTVDCIKVLAHSDLWKNNLMFKFEDKKGFENPKHCMILDFQFAKYSPLQIDVLMLIVLNTRRGHCEKMLEHYLKFYYNVLKRELVKNNIDLESIMSWKKFEESCEYFMHVAIVYNAITTMITHIAPEKYVQMTSEEYEAFIIKGRYPIVKTLMQDDPFYASCVLESIERLVDYFNI